MKLWQKNNTATTAKTEAFTVGNDRQFDLLLAGYDVRGSQAHIAMLAEVGLLTVDEYQSIKKGLEQIASEIEAGSFIIDEAMEDIHSQVEWLLTQRIGESAKKIHSGRSRNDQVAVDIKLYLRDAIQHIKEELAVLFDLLMTLAEYHKEVLLPGYTHLQVAMPSSFGLWFSAYGECLSEDMEMLAAAYAVVNKNPLGSGAGYGSSFPLKRSTTTRLLQFRTMHYNAAAAQMSRGRTEKMLAMAMSCIAGTLGKMAMDICLYNSQNFAFLQFPEAYTTGSSIMPHKKNPDIFELVRGKCNRIQSLPNELTLLLSNLPSGYHRDMQLTTEIIFPGIELLRSCIDILCETLPHVQVNKDILKDEKYKYIFSVETVNELVNSGISFRDAYRQVGESIADQTFLAKSYDPADYTHEGSIGNLCLDEIRMEWEMVIGKIPAV